MWGTNLWAEDGDELAKALADWAGEEREKPPLESLPEGVRSLAERVCDVISSVEYHDLRVERLYLIKRGGRHAVYARAGGGFYFQEDGKQRNFSSSEPCPECDGFAVSANPVEGHGPDCPLRIVLDVMRS